MIATECPNCQGRVFVFARACRLCGARNEPRTLAIAIAAALSVLLIVGGAVTLSRLRGQQSAIATPPASRSEFGWLSAAMTECDAEAATKPDTLEFLVIPLKSTPADAEQWRRKSLNNIGNATLLTADDMLDGLGRGALSLSTAQYLFSMRDEATGIVYKWSPSVGVKKFLTADAASTEQFKVQFQLGDETSGAEWGAAFLRRKGNCYWVNAILGH